MKTNLVPYSFVFCLFLSSSAKGEVRVFQKAEEVPNSCLRLGKISSDDSNPGAAGGSAMATMRLKAKAAEWAADSIFIQIMSGGQINNTYGNGTMLRCEGPWILGALPPVVLPLLTEGYDRERPLHVPARRSESVGSLAPKMFADLTLGTQFADVKKALNAKGILIRQAASGKPFDPFQSETRVGFLMPVDDPRGRRWLFVRGLAPAEEIAGEGAVLFLSFDSRQTLITVGAMTLSDQSKQRLDKLVQTLDAKYARLPGIRFGSRHDIAVWGSASDPQSIAVIVGVEKPMPFFAVAYTIDPVQQRPLLPGM